MWLIDILNDEMQQRCVCCLKLHGWNESVHGESSLTLHMKDGYIAEMEKYRLPLASLDLWIMSYSHFNLSPLSSKDLSVMYGSNNWGVQPSRQWKFYYQHITYNTKEDR